VEKPGFAPLLREFNVQTDSTVQRGLVLKLSTDLEQRHALVDSGAAAAAQNPANPTQLRVGGSAQQAKLIRKIQPVYPVSAKTAHLQGKVTLDVDISKDGIPEDIRVVSSPSDDLTQSALEAVRQWRYSETLLNGEPVGVVTEVIVNYTLAP
jgi:TonB family protein